MWSVPVYKFLAKSRVRGKAKSGRQKPPDRGTDSKNTVSSHFRRCNPPRCPLNTDVFLWKNTYAFISRIVKGANFQQPREVEALALYNESCRCNYISARFARDQLQILSSEPSDDIDGDCALVWVCEGLGRYEQRSVFWIAPDADFDLLFGREDDFNSQSDEGSQFDCGIESGILSQELPRKEPRKSFQGGINDEYLLPVERSKASDLAGRSRMPSLAEIKIQLAAQLDCSLERTLRHEKRRALNIYNPHYVASPGAPLRDRRHAHTARLAATTPEASEPDGSEGVDRTVRLESTDLCNGSIFKGNKRVHSEEHGSPSIDAVGGGLQSPKLRNVRARSMLTQLSDQTVVNVLGEITKAGHVSCLNPEPSESKFTVEGLKEPPILEDKNNTEQEDERHLSVGSAPDEVLFSCMDRECSLGDRNLHDSASISLSSRESSTLLESKAQDAPPPICSTSYKAAIESPGQQMKERRRSDVGDWTDKKFKEFWTDWDEKVGNWYHIDELTKKRIWYAPPKAPFVD
jgi:hypothetical protein